MGNNHHEKTWEEIQEHGIFDHIQTWDDYVDRYELGFTDATAFLATQTNLWRKQVILASHRLLFEQIAPWAGKESTRQETIASIPGSPLELRDFEFQLLEAQMELLEKASENQTALIRGVAFHHSRLLCMHPFRDGNGRTARLLLLKQMERITGKAAPFNNTKETYIEALQECHPNGNLAPLSNLLHHSFLGKPDPAVFLPVPFRIHSLQQWPAQPENALAESQREEADILNSEKTPKKVRWLNRINWGDVERLTAVNPTPNLPTVQRLWQENQNTPFSPKELEVFLAQLENLNPWTQPTGLFRRQQGTSWKPVTQKLLAPWKEPKGSQKTADLRNTPEMH